MSEQLREALIGAANYIDTLGGDSKAYRTALSNAAPGAPQPEMIGAARRLTEAEIENCIDRANRKFNGRNQGPSGQQLTSYDDWKHWLAREVEAASHAAATAPAGGVTDDSTPGQWFVRKRIVDGEVVDCFVAAPDCQGHDYDAEILGDDEYRGTVEDENAGIKRKLADCELIVKAVTQYRAALTTAARVAENTGPSDWPIGEARRYAQGVEDGRKDAFAAARAAEPRPLADMPALKAEIAAKLRSGELSPQGYDVAAEAEKQQAALNRFRAVAMSHCFKAPPGWECTRDMDHTGPCALIPVGNDEGWLP